MVGIYKRLKGQVKGKNGRKTRGAKSFKEILPDKYGMEGPYCSSKGQK
jgi:hypothetical protein